MHVHFSSDTIEALEVLFKNASKACRRGNICNSTQVGMVINHMRAIAIRADGSNSFNALSTGSNLTGRGTVLGKILKRVRKGSENHWPKTLPEPKKKPPIKKKVK